MSTITPGSRMFQDDHQARSPVAPGKISVHLGAFRTSPDSACALQWYQPEAWSTGQLCSHRQGCLGEDHGSPSWQPRLAWPNSNSSVSSSSRRTAEKHLWLEELFAFLRVLCSDILYRLTHVSNFSIWDTWCPSIPETGKEHYQWLQRGDT